MLLLADEKLSLNKFHNPFGNSKSPKRCGLNSKKEGNSRLSRLYVETRHEMSKAVTLLAMIFPALTLFFATTFMFAQEKPASGTTKPAAAGSKPGTAQSSAETEAAEAREKLLKAVQNPVASLISVPIQNNNNFNIGPFDRTQDVLNIQPVIPAHLNEKWMLITRIIQPIVWQPYPSQPTSGEFGLGDMNPTFFLSPAKPGKMIWGVGPAFVIPTATNQILGQGKLSLGPSVVALVQPAHWTLGVLMNNVWSVAGSGSRSNVNQMLLQYFVNYNMKKGWYLTMSPIITADWEAASGNVWTVPFGGGIGRVMKLGFQPANLTVQFYGNAIHPEGASPWGMRVQVAFLYPKKPRQ